MRSICSTKKGNADMNDLISRKEAIDILYNYKRMLFDGVPDPVVYGVQGAIEVIKAMPYAIIDNEPTADAVTVIRCKDCKHNPKYTNDYMYGRCVFCCEDDFYSGTPSDDFYCGYGERKETDNE